MYKAGTGYFIFLLIFILMPGPNSFAESRFDTQDADEQMFENSFDDSGDDEFMEESLEYDLPEAEQETGKFYDFIQSLKWTYSHELSFATEKDPGIVTNESSLRLEWEKLFLDSMFFRFDGTGSVMPASDHRADAEDKHFLLDGDIREMYIQKGYDRLSFKLGQQILVWGESDLSVVTDVVSPRDQSDLIFIDLEDSRLGQLMFTADAYTRYGNYSLFINPRPEFDRLPDDGTRYDIELSDSGNTVTVRDKPDYSDVEYGFRWKKTLGSLDLALMAADLFRNTELIAQVEYASDGTMILHQGYDRYTMGGAAMSYAMGSFLFKSEIAYKHDFPMQNMISDGSMEITGYHLLDAAGGFDFDANGKYQVTCEVSNRHIFDYDSTISEADKDNTAFYFNILKKFLNDNLELQYSLYYRFQHESVMHDMQALYKYTDNTQFEIRYTNFNIRDKDSDMWYYRDEDRISVGFSYFF